MAAGRAGHPKLSMSGRGRSTSGGFRGSLRNATVKDMIDNGVGRFKLDQPWISAKENQMVCGGFGIGCEVVSCRMLGMNEALLLPH